MASIISWWLSASMPCVFAIFLVKLFEGWCELVVMDYPLRNPIEVLLLPVVTH